MEKLKVLVVDDEPGIRSGVTRILSHFSVGYPFMDKDITYDVSEASTGEEAIEMIGAGIPDVILLDNKLPGMDGVDVLRYINEKQLNIVVMMITSYASLELAVKATDMGAYDFVPKPFTPQELKASIENITKKIFLKRMTQKMNKEGKSIRFQFLSILSHELKAPLNAIEGYLKMMKEQEAGNDIRQYEQMIARSLERVKGMRGLIMDLLDLTRIESGKKKRELKNIGLCSLANAAIDTMRPVAIQKDLEIIVDCPKDLTYYADPEELEIIFNNLISNAIKYNVEKGKVQVDIFIENNALNISIKDSGIGISESEMANLFQEFVRIRNEQTKHITGSGLGLSIVKKITVLYNGNIDVKSRLGEGSTFTVILPVKNM